jgi:DNA helicase II / ATP-dependent DNA helicase PcrA
MQLSKEKNEILSDNKHNIKVIAGPGSGKTSLIIKKVSDLVLNGVSPDKILVITYTNKSTEDIKKKMFLEFNQNKNILNKLQIFTFHGFCAQFIRENQNFFGNYKGYKVLDDLEQLLFIVKFNKFIRDENIKNISLQKLKNYFGRIKDNYLDEDIKKKEHPIISSYINYCLKLKENNKMDYGDLINIVYSCITTNLKLKTITKNKFDYIFIDEYQDINRNQEKLIKQFMGVNTKILVVGDKNQSIYGFRGSDSKIFDSFEESFDNSKIYYLKKNYRSTKKIIDTSNYFLNLSNFEEIIANHDSKDGKLTEEGEKIILKQYLNEDSEAKDIVEIIKKMKSEKFIHSYSCVAILLRSVKGDSKRFIEKLKDFNIKFEVIGEGGLFELDYIKEIFNCYDQLSNKSNTNFLIKNKFLKIDATIPEKIIKKGALATFYKIIEKSVYLQCAIKKNNTSILMNLGRFSKILSIYYGIFDNQKDYLSNFYKNISQIKSEYVDFEQPEIIDDDSVKILTLHKAKGLQFPFVIIPGVNRNNYKIKNDDYISELFKNYNSKKDLERAFYVAITRAKQKLFISYSSKPAEYISKLPKSTNLINRKNDRNKTLFEEEIEMKFLDAISLEEKILKLTYYKLIEYWKCPFAYQLRFYYNFEIPRTYSLTYGTILHTLLYNINLKIKNKEPYNIDEIIGEKVPDYMTKFNFKNALQNYLSDFKDELKNIVSIEKPFEFKFGDSIISGRIDLIIKNKDNKKTIVEFKSGDYNLNKEKDVKKQINLYALSQNNPEINKGVIYFFKDRKKIIFDLNQNQTELNIYDTINNIKLNQFETNTDNCSKCVFYEYLICPYCKKFKTNDLDLDELDDYYSDSLNEI